MIGPTGEIAPADKKLYALRDVTGTVASIPLITASIMCKKMAEGIDSLVLDVKWGTGAFMRTIEDATALAQSMVRVGKAMNKGMVALLTDMNQPLGRTAGNALEIIESMECLQGKYADEDLMNITMALTAEMLVLGKKAATVEEATGILKKIIASGAAFAKFKEMAALHGDDVSALDDLSKLPKASIVKPIPHPAPVFWPRWMPNPSGGPSSSSAAAAEDRRQDRLRRRHFRPRQDRRQGRKGPTARRRACQLAGKARAGHGLRRKGLRNLGPARRRAETHRRPHRGLNIQSRKTGNNRKTRLVRL
jgi:hypothetical protein